MLRSSWALILVGHRGSKTVCEPSQFRHLGGEEGQQSGVGRKWPPLGQPWFWQRCCGRVWFPEHMGQVGVLSGQV